MGNQPFRKTTKTRMFASNHEEQRGRPISCWQGSQGCPKPPRPIYGCAPRHSTFSGGPKGSFFQQATGCFGGFLEPAGALSTRIRSLGARSSAHESNRWVDVNGVPQCKQVLVNSFSVQPGAVPHFLAGCNKKPTRLPFFFCRVG